MPRYDPNSIPYISFWYPDTSGTPRQVDHLAISDFLKVFEIVSKMIDLDINMAVSRSTHKNADQVIDLRIEIPNGRGVILRP